MIQTKDFRILLSAKSSKDVSQEAQQIFEMLKILVATDTTDLSEGEGRPSGSRGQQASGRREVY